MLKFFFLIALSGVGLLHGLNYMADHILTGGPAVAILAQNDRNRACMQDGLSDACLGVTRP